MSFFKACCLGLFCAILVLAVLAVMKPSPPDTTSTYLEAYAISKKFVEDELRSPSTADFPWRPTGFVQLQPGYWRIASYVDAQNAFGGTVRTHYVCEVRTEGGTNWELVSLEWKER